MDINDNIKPLLESLDPADKIVLNDKQMYIIKLYNNKKFKQWLKLKGLDFKISQLHGDNNKIYNDLVLKNGDTIDPIFITMGIVTKENLKDIDFVCCKVDVGKIAQHYFQNKEKSSGIVLNGTFFFLQQHLNSGVYGINNMNKEFNPIGFYSHKITENYKKYNTVLDVSTPSILEEGKSSTNLNVIGDILSVLKIDNNNNISIIPLNKYNHRTTTEQDQVLTGHSLVYNGNVTMTLDRLGYVVTNKQIGKIQRNQMAILCHWNKSYLNVSEIINILINLKNGNKNQEVYIRDPVTDIVEKTMYNGDNLKSLYDTTIIRSIYGDNFISEIPPGMPMHASDLNPRTCILIDNKHNVILMHIEGRHRYGGGIGIDLFDLAKLCKELGAVHAINIDGGGSSKIQWKEQGVQSYYDGPEAYEIGNAIIVTPK